MPEHLRALVVIVGLAAVVFAFAKAPACAMANSIEDFQRRRNLWFAITIATFLAQNFWIYIVVVAAMLLLAVPREVNKLALFFFLMFAVPVIPEQIPGFGIVKYLFTIHYVRLLALIILLPAFLSLQRHAGTDRFGRLFPDWLIAGYVALNVALQLPIDTFTNTLRSGVFYSFIDIFLPYYVASRSLKNVKEFKDALMAFVVAAMVLSIIGIFEFAKHWALYSVLDDALGIRWDFGNYLLRGDKLRALGTTGQPIVMGYVMAVAMGFLLYLKRSVPKPTAWGLGFILLIVGLIVPVSRGPWVGAAAMLLVFLATSPSAASRFAKYALLGAVVFLAVRASPVGPAIVDYLPFVGTIDDTTVAYRERLLDISIQVIMQNPFFGDLRSIGSPAMQELRQGEGIIDIVNTYAGVGLTSGLVGLSLFAGFFIAVCAGILGRMKSISDRSSEEYLLGQALFSTLLGILVIIFTVSSITVIPVIYWAVAGLG